MVMTSLYKTNQGQQWNSRDSIEYRFQETQFQLRHIPFNCLLQGAG